MWFLGGGLLIAVSTGLYVWSTDLSRAIQMRKAAIIEMPFLEVQALFNADLEHLPASVKRHMKVTGLVGHPVVTAIQLRFDAIMHDSPGAAGMFGPVDYYERFDHPDRLFLVTTKMKGLPSAVVNHFNRDQTTIDPQLAGMVNAVNIDSLELTQAKTVTVFNDLAIFAPARALEPCLRWLAIDDRRPRVTFSLAIITSWLIVCRVTWAC